MRIFCYSIPALFFLVCTVFVKVYSTESLVLNSSDSTILRKWFGGAGTCALTESGEGCPSRDMDFAFSRQFMALPSERSDGGDSWSNFDGHCCLSEMPIKARGFLNHSQGVSDPNHKPVVNIVSRMSKHNMTILFLGDSMMAQTNYAFIAELRRECLIHELSMPEPATESDKLLFAEKLGRSVWILSIYRWYGVRIIFADFREVRELHHLETLVTEIERVFSTSVAVFANLGLHLPRLAEDLGKPGREGMREALEALVLWMGRLKKREDGTVPILLETSATHFNAPLGSFELWETPDGYDVYKYNTWDKELPLYHCRPHNQSEVGMNRLENVLLYELLTDHKLTKELPVIEIHAHFAPHYRMHYGNCGREAEYRIKIVDCVHFCAYSPLMWAPIWHQMENRLRVALQSKLNAERIPKRLRQ